MSTTATPGYPVTFEFDPPDKIARWRVIGNVILAIPQFIILYVLGLVVQVLVFVAWILGVFTGKIPEGIQTVITMITRYGVRVVTYAMFLREEYPPFAFDTSFADPANDPRVRFDVTPAVDGRNRLTIFFRLFMVIPHAIVLFFLLIGLYVVMIIAWFAVLFTGRWPAGLRNYAVGYIRWGTRVRAYFNLLTDEYPPFSMS
jgi:hypothetical protein